MRRHLSDEVVAPLDHVISLHDSEVPVVHDDELQASPRNAICHEEVGLTASLCFWIFLRQRSSPGPACTSTRGKKGLPKPRRLRGERYARDGRG